MCFDRMDPSCCLGFFCATRNAFEGWCEVVRELAVPPSPGCDYPVFGIAEGRARDGKLKQMLRFCLVFLL